MRTAALIILIILTLRQAIRAMVYANSKEDNKLALMLFPTVVFSLVYLGVI